MRFTPLLSTLVLLGSLKLAAGLPVDAQIEERALVVVVETVIVTKTAGAPGPQNTQGGQDGQDWGDHGSGEYRGQGWGHHRHQPSVAPQPQPPAQPQPQPEPQPQPQPQPEPQPQPQPQAPEQTSSANDTPQPSAAPSGGSAGLSEDDARVLELHNIARRERCNGLNDLVWDETAATLARNWVEGCPGLVHSSGETRIVNGIGYGENLAWSSNGDAKGADLLGMWVDEERTYRAGTLRQIKLTQSDFIAFYRGNGQGDPGQQVLHYTQVVWAATTGVGCAVKNCGSGGALLACNYGPGGNNGAYAENVDQPCGVN